MAKLTHRMDWIPVVRLKTRAPNRLLYLSNLPVSPSWAKPAVMKRSEMGLGKTHPGDVRCRAIPFFNGSNP